MKRQLCLTIIAASLSLFACKKDESKPKAEIDSKEVSVHYDEQHAFTIKNPGSSSVTWSSTDESVGTVSSSGVFKAKKIGTTTVKAVSSGFSIESKVTVTPYSTLCAEPFWQLSASKATTKSKEKRALISETATGLAYTGENVKVRNVMYIFESDKMTAAALLLSNNSAVVEESAKFLLERYTAIGSSDDYYFFTDGKTVTIAITYEETLGFVALYSKYSQTTISSDLKSRFAGILSGLKAELNK